MIGSYELDSFQSLSLLTSSERHALADHFQERELRKNQLLLSAGQTDRSAYLILEGRLIITRATQEGREVILGYAEAGEWIGELALLSGRPRCATVVALEKCRIAELSLESFETAQDIKGLLMLLLSRIGARLEDASTRIAVLSSHRVVNKLLFVLAQMAEPASECPDQCVVIRPRPPHRVFAGLIGTTREAVTRALAELQASNLILLDEDMIFLRKDHAEQILRAVIS